MMAIFPLEIRQRAADLCSGKISDSEFLHYLVDTLAINKNKLPDDLRQSLCEAFGQRSSKNNATIHNRQDALKRVRKVQCEHIRVPEFLSDILHLYAHQGSLFWNCDAPFPTKSAYRNILGDLYHGNERGTVSNCIRHAFYSVALYEVIQQIIQLHGAKRLTPDIANFCANFIWEECRPGSPQSRDNVVKQLRCDHKTGAVYKQYADKAGYAIIFYLFILPSNTYEKYLNRTCDVDTVLSHFQATGFKMEEISKSAATSIMKYVNDRFIDQISIFRPALATTARLNNNFAQRKRAGSNDVLLARWERPQKRVTTQRLSNAATEAQHTQLHRTRYTEPSASDSQDRDGHGRMQSVRSDCGREFPIITSDEQPQLQPSDPTGAEDLREVTISQLSAESVEQTAGAQLSVGAGSLQSDGSSLSFPFNARSNAAHLMQEFTIESMMPNFIPSNTNAAQLMQDFSLESSTLADCINAAQLMQQFDLFDEGYTLHQE